MLTNSSNGSVSEGIWAISDAMASSSCPCALALGLDFITHRTISVQPTPGFSIQSARIDRSGASFPFSQANPIQSATHTTPPWSSQKAASSTSSFQMLLRRATEAAAGAAAKGRHHGCGHCKPLLSATAAPAMGAGTQGQRRSLFGYVLCRKGARDSPHPNGHRRAPRQAMPCLTHPTPIPHPTASAAEGRAAPS